MSENETKEVNTAPKGGDELIRGGEEHLADHLVGALAIFAIGLRLDI